ncbi:MAG: tyrosine-type recombinase/integrase [Lachnospiraceae bacterium]|nr:tyrosine-type recombinase/integrase [Lachnospiraceae bacterium]
MKNRNTFLIKEFQRYLQDKNLSRNTIAIYVHGTELFQEYLGDSLLTREAVQEYVKELNIHYEKSTANLYSIALNQYFIWSGREDCCIKTRGNHRKKRVENVLSKEEYKKMLEYLLFQGDEKYYVLFRTLAGTGIRISELKYVTIEAVSEGMAIVHNKGKTREVYIGKSLQKEIMRYCSMYGIVSGVVFLGNRKTPITRGAVNQKLLRIAEKVGVDRNKVHPHAFRHLFAKEYMKSYQNIAELSCVLGHENIETTMIYLASSSQEYIEKVSGLDL